MENGSENSLESLIKYQNEISILNVDCPCDEQANHFEYFDETERLESIIFSKLKHKYYRGYVHLDQSIRIWTISSEPFDTVNDEGDQSQKQNQFQHRRQLSKFKSVYYDEKVEKANAKNILLIHGFVASAGFWASNLDVLVDAGYKVWAIDMPGFGRSSRVAFSQNTMQTESQYVSIFAKYIHKMKLAPLTIVGHSMGGFLTGLVTLSLQNIINKVVFVDSWGFRDMKNSIIERLYTYPYRKLLKTLFLPKFVSRMILYNMMPYSVFYMLRFFGPEYASYLIHFFRSDIAKRYHNLIPDDRYFMAKYIFLINSPPKATGEESFLSLSLPIGWSKYPMVKRLNSIKFESDIEIHFIYGENSWISSSSGYEFKTSRQDLKVTVDVIPDSGHHVNADQPELFNKALLRILNC